MTLVFSSSDGGAITIHSKCSKETDVSGYIAHVSEMTDEDMIRVTYGLSKMTDNNFILMKENSNLRDEKEAMLREVRNMIEKVALITSDRDNLASKLDTLRQHVRNLTGIADAIAI